MSGIHVGQTYLDARGRERAGRGLGPLDEADRVFEVGLEVAPLGRGEALEPVEVEVRDVDRRGRVAVADRERRARDWDGDPERPAGAADEGRLAAAELAADGDDVAGPKLARERGGNRLGLRRRGGGQLHAQNRPS